MSTLKLIENGTTRKAANPRRRASAANPRKRRRRNPVSAAPVKRLGTAANPRKRRRRRNPTVLTTAANPRRRRAAPKRRRRNGVIAKRSNGMFGNSKETAKAVLSLLGGLAATKVGGGLLSPTAAGFLASVGLGGYAKPLVEAGLALTFNKYVGNLLGGKEAGKMAMIGGLSMAAMSFIESLIPQTSVYNPFASPNMAPLVLNSPSIVSRDAALAVAAGSQASKVGGVFNVRQSPYLSRPRY